MWDSSFTYGNEDLPGEAVTLIDAVCDGILQCDRKAERVAELELLVGRQQDGGQQAAIVAHMHLDLISLFTHGAQYKESTASLEQMRRESLYSGTLSVPQLRTFCETLNDLLTCHMDNRRQSAFDCVVPLLQIKDETVAAVAMTLGRDLCAQSVRFCGLLVTQFMQREFRRNEGKRISLVLATSGNLEVLSVVGEWLATQPLQALHLLMLLIKKSICDKRTDSDNRLSLLEKLLLLLESTTDIFVAQRGLLTLSMFLPCVCSLIEGSSLRRVLRVFVRYVIWFQDGLLLIDNKVESCPAPHERLTPMLKASIVRGFISIYGIFPGPLLTYMRDAIGHEARGRELVLPLFASVQLHPHLIMTPAAIASRWRTRLPSEIAAECDLYSITRFLPLETVVAEVPERNVFSESLLHPDRQESIQTMSTDNSISPSHTAATSPAAPPAHQSRQPQQAAAAASAPAFVVNTFSPTIMPSQMPHAISSAAVIQPSASTPNTSTARAGAQVSISLPATPATPGTPAQASQALSAVAEVDEDSGNHLTVDTQRGYGQTGAHANSMNSSVVSQTGSMVTSAAMSPFVLSPVHPDGSRKPTHTRTNSTGDDSIASTAVFADCSSDLMRDASELRSHTRFDKTQFEQAIQELYLELQALRYGQVKVSPEALRTQAVVFQTQLLYEEYARACYLETIGHLHMQLVTKTNAIHTLKKALQDKDAATKSAPPAPPAFPDLCSRIVDLETRNRKLEDNVEALRLQAETQKEVQQLKVQAEQYQMELLLSKGRETQLQAELAKERQLREQTKKMGDQLREWEDALPDRIDLGSYLKHVSVELKKNRMAVDTLTFELAQARQTSMEHEAAAKKALQRIAHVSENLKETKQALDAQVVNTEQIKIGCNARLKALENKYVSLKNVNIELEKRVMALTLEYHMLRRSLSSPSPHPSESTSAEG